MAASEEAPPESERAFLRACHRRLDAVELLLHDDGEARACLKRRSAEVQESERCRRRVERLREERDAERAEAHWRDYQAAFRLGELETWAAQQLAVTQELQRRLWAYECRFGRHF